MLNLLSAVSLVLCVATGLLSVRGTWYTDRLEFLGQVGATKQTTFELVILYSRIHVNYFNITFVPQERNDFIRTFNDGHVAERFLLESDANKPMNERTRKGLRWFQYVDLSGLDPFHNDMPRWNGWRLTFPLPLLTLLAAGLPLHYLTGAVRSRHRVTRGHCLNCGYDLRATPERCPECGFVAIVPSV